MSRRRPYRKAASLCTVEELVDGNPVSALEGRVHRVGRYDEPVGDKDPPGNEPPENQKNDNRHLLRVRTKYIFSGFFDIEAENEAQARFRTIRNRVSLFKAIVSAIMWQCTTFPVEIQCPKVHLLSDTYRLRVRLNVLFPV